MPSPPPKENLIFYDSMFVCSNLNHRAPQTHGSGHLQTKKLLSSQISEEVPPTSGFKERNQPSASGRMDPLLFGT